MLRAFGKQRREGGGANGMESLLNALTAMITQYAVV